MVIPIAIIQILEVSREGDLVIEDMAKRECLPYIAIIVLMLQHQVQI